MDITTMFTLTYGIFIAGVEEGGKKNGCIINTAVQSTAEPVRMNITMLKENLTTQMIKKKGSLTISVLSIDAPLDLIRSFGMQSGREYSKFDGVKHKIDKQGNPYFSEHTISYMSLLVCSILDLDTHYLFICDVVEGEKTEKGQPMTYTDYRALKSGKAIDKTNSIDTPEIKTYVCSVCHYVYDEDIPFEKLPDEWVCPVCSQPKSVFVAE